MQSTTKSRIGFALRLMLAMTLVFSGAVINAQPAMAGSVTVGPLKITLTASKTSVLSTGENVTWTYSIQNIGTEDVYEDWIEDTLYGSPPMDAFWSLPGYDGTWAPGQTYTVTYTAWMQGAVGTSRTNTFWVYAMDNYDWYELNVSETVTFIAPVVKPAAPTVTKSVSPDQLPEPGGSVTYTFSITNTDSRSVTVHSISDDRLGDLLPDAKATNGGADIVLAPGGSFTFTKTANVSGTAGVPHTNTVSVVVREGASNLSDPGTASATVTLLSASLTVSKSADRTSFTKAGDVIAYSISVQNTGQAPLTGVSLSDSLAGITTPVLASGDTDGDGVLDPGETWIYTYSYTVTQADVDSGSSIVNVATVDTDQTDPVDSSSVTVANASTAAFTVVKDADLAQFTEAGDVIAYTVTVENTGERSLSGISLSDTLIGITVPVLTGDTDSDGRLDADETWVYSYSYTVTQADVDSAEGIENYATVTTAEAGSKSDGITVPNAGTASFSVVKAADVTSFVAAGDMIDYTVTVENTGTRSITGVGMSDTLIGITAPVLAGDTDSDGRLDVDEIWVYSYSYTVTQADVDSNEDILNTATVTSAETAPVMSDTVTVTNDATLGWALKKSAAPTAFSAAGDEISYAVTLENIGTRSITEVGFSDSLDGITEPTLSGDEGVAGVLDPGETWMWVYTYSVTQADVDSAEDLVNTVSITSAELPETTDSATVVNEGIASYSLEKVADVESFSAAGDEITYTVSLRNTGTRTLTGVTMDDSLVGAIEPLLIGDVVGDPVLDVDGEWTYIYTYTVTQADVDSAEPILNVATVSSVETDSVASKEVSVANMGTASYSISQSAEPATYSEEGVAVAFSVQVENTGTRSLTDVVLTNSLAGVTAPVVSGDIDGDGVLDPGEIWVYAFAYTTTQADVDSALDIVNVASVSSAEVGTLDSNAATVSYTPLPVEPVDPVDPVDPVEPVDPVDPVTPSKPGGSKTVTLPEKANPKTGDAPISAIALLALIGSAGVGVFAIRRRSERDAA